MLQLYVFIGDKHYLQGQKVESERIIYHSNKELLAFISDKN
jgi:hypothetical protein